MGFLRIKVTDTITNKESGKEYNLIRVEKTTGGDAGLVLLKSVDTEEEIKVSVNDYRAHYKITKYGPQTDKVYFL